jgi:hypothetical protein
VWTKIVLILRVRFRNMEHASITWHFHCFLIHIEPWIQIALPVENNFILLTMDKKNHSISFYYKLCSSWLLPHYKRFGVSVQKIVTDHRLSIMYHSLKLVHALLVVGFKCVTQQWYCFLPEYGCVTLFKLCTSPMLHHQQTLLINYQVSSSNFA